MMPVDNTTGYNQTDQQMVERVLRGDTQAFGGIIRHTERLVTQIVYKMITREEDRRDILQDVYMKAFTHLPGFKFQARLSTWIGQIAYNACMSHLQRRKLILPGTWPEQTAPYGGNPDDDSGIRPGDLSGILAGEIGKLPPVYRTLIVLYHQEDLSYADIAHVTGLPEGTVKSYLFRARKTLKDNLSAQYKKEEL